MCVEIARNLKKLGETNSNIMWILILSPDAIFADLDENKVNMAGRVFGEVLQEQSEEIATLCKTGFAMT